MEISPRRNGPGISLVETYYLSAASWLDVSFPAIIPT